LPPSKGDAVCMATQEDMAVTSACSQQPLHEPTTMYNYNTDLILWHILQRMFM
jgi:hypothetical protein